MNSDRETVKKKKIIGVMPATSFIIVFVFRITLTTVVITSILATLFIPTFLITNIVVTIVLSPSRLNLEAPIIDVSKPIRTLSFYKKTKPDFDVIKVDPSRWTEEDSDGQALLLNYRDRVLSFWKPMRDFSSKRIFC